MKHSWEYAGMEMCVLPWRSTEKDDKLLVMVIKWKNIGTKIRSKHFLTSPLMPLKSHEYTITRVHKTLHFTHNLFIFEINSTNFPVTMKITRGESFTSYCPEPCWSLLIAMPEKKCFAEIFFHQLKLPHCRTYYRSTHILWTESYSLSQLLKRVHKHNPDRQLNIHSEEQWALGLALVSPSQVYFPSSEKIRSLWMHSPLAKVAIPYGMAGTFFWRELPMFFMLLSSADDHVSLV